MKEDTHKQKQKVQVRAPDGSMVEGTELSFEEISSPWTKVKCEDGAVIMVKVEITAVTRMDVHDPVTGVPIYNIGSQPIFRVTEVPMELRKIPNAPPKRTDMEVG
jgi:hypothetical protein